MVTRSDHNWKQHCDDVYKLIMQKTNKKKADIFIKHYKEKFDIFNRSFIDYKLAYQLLDDYYYCKKVGTRWIACVGVGGTGKTTTLSNVLYFLDSEFNNQCVGTTTDWFIKKISSFPSTNAMRAVLLDEPDDRYSSQSKQGKVLRKILGKIRQQKLFIGICATDLKDIPPYIFRKIDIVIFLPYQGAYFYIKDQPKKQRYLLQEIRSKYSEKGYKIFFDLKNNGGILTGKTIGESPLSVQEEKNYLINKVDDYKKDIAEYLNMCKAVDTKKDIRTELIINMKQNGLRHDEIARHVGVTRSRITQILNNTG